MLVCCHHYKSPLYHNFFFQSPDNSETDDEHTSPREKFHWRDDSGRDRMGVASSEGEESDDEEEVAGNETMNTTLTEGCIIA